MAEATMAEILTAVHALVDAGLSCPVERGWQDDPPTTTTAYVLRKGDSAEDGLHMAGDLAGGVTFKRYSLNIIIEAPAGGEATEDALDALREDVRAIIEANRELEIDGKDSPADGNDDGCECPYVTRKGETNTNAARWITASWRV